MARQFSEADLVAIDQASSLWGCVSQKYYEGGVAKERNGFTFIKESDSTLVQTLEADIVTNT